MAGVRDGAGAALPAAAVAWIMLVTGSALAATGLSAASGLHMPAWGVTTVLLAGVAVAMEWPVRGLHRTLGEIEPWVILGPFFVWVLGVHVTLAAATLSILWVMAVDLVPQHKWMFNVAVRCLCVLATAAVMGMGADTPAPWPAIGIETTAALAAMVAGVGVWWLVGWTCVSVVVALASRQPVGRHLLEGSLLDARAALLFAFVGPVVLLAMAYQPWLLPLLGLPVAGAVASADRARRHHLEARTDDLTGLANRVAIYEALNETISMSGARGRRFGLCMLDLNGFKEINDTFGHDTGDVVIQKVAERLGAFSCDAWVAGRLGGDEFTLIWRDHAERGEYLRRADEIGDVLMTPIPTAHGDVVVGASLGISVYPDDGDGTSALLRHADLEMYRDKARGRAGGQIPLDIDIDRSLVATT